MKPKIKNLPKVPNNVTQYESLEKRMLTLKKDIEGSNFKAIKTTRTEKVKKIVNEPIMLCVGPSVAEKVD